MGSGEGKSGWYVPGKKEEMNVRCLGHEQVHTCKITPHEVLERAWDNCAGVWHRDEMLFEDQSPGLLPIWTDGRLGISALKKVNHLGCQGGVFGQSKCRVGLSVERNW